MGEAIAVGGINKGTTGMPVGLFSIVISDIYAKIFMYALEKHFKFISKK